MRPVVKGPAPQEAYNPYRDALEDLVDQIGSYCSYCEQVITHAPEVEHVQPKSLVPGLEHSWDNFLLGCKSCNSVKSNNPVDLNQIAFPDTDNTFLGLSYELDGHVKVSTLLPPYEAGLMASIVKLVKLHRHPDEAHRRDRPTKRDKRVELRLDVWEIAQYQLNLYESFLWNAEFSATLAEQITDYLAPAKGFFSVWMTVFRNHPDILHKFIEAFPGTDPDCFDANGHPVSRPGGRF